MSVTHIAGLPITVEERYVRQRCAWCTTLLVDVDATTLNYELSIPPEERRPGTWQAGRLVTVDGPASFVLDEGADLPDDACTILDGPDPLGEALMRSRLAATALDLDERAEASAILSALCGWLVEQGARDPMEDG